MGNSLTLWDLDNFLRWMDLRLSDNNIDYFHSDEECEHFEDFSQDGETRYWYASDLAICLGYQSLSSLNNAIGRAMQACTALGIEVVAAMEPVKRELDGRTTTDYKLSRFGCYLVAMNGDPKKPQVASAQAYFIGMAETLRQYIQGENVERVLIRDDISERERSLSGVAHRAGVDNYAFFKNAGYRGMYNMNLSELRMRKGIDAKSTPLDYMGKEELAANLFRITQTEAKIKNDNVRGQSRLENTAETVGRKVRETMLELSGTAPENLPVPEDISKVRQGLKRAERQFKKLDNSNG